MAVAKDNEKMDIAYATHYISDWKFIFSDSDEHRPAPLWRFCASGGIYKTLWLYLLT